MRRLARAFMCFGADVLIGFNSLEPQVNGGDTRLARKR
jgi:hypothetical protein